MTYRPTVAAYYFGNYHPGDARNTQIKGDAWSEWELVKAARPRFHGHKQPRVPLWGYQDESDPQVMAQKIDCAADHGIDVFLFDWYWYNDGPFLEAPIERGFKGATNNGRMKFAFMWANHDWIDIHPYKKGRPHKLLYPGVVTPATFQTITQHLRQLRLERAAELLKSGEYNVTEAALEVGYHSLSHFSAAFHQTFGCCPGLYPLQTPAQQSS